MRIVLGRSVFRVSKCSRHPEVDQEYPTSLKSNNQILAAPFHGLHGFPFELGRDLLRLERPGHAMVADVDPIEAAADENGLEPGSDRLDLGQLGHAG